MPDQPLSYHITFGTYGARLHGDERGTVDRRHNQSGDPILGRNDAWRHAAENKLRFDPIILTLRQRHDGEAAIPEICRRGGWNYHVAAVQADHVHVLVTAAANGEIVRRLLKRWLSEELSKFWPLPEGQGWWAESGSVKWIWTEDYFRNVFEYVRRQSSLPSGSPVGVEHPPG
jgi:REP element-mobilizing transposase RayT